jgi:hypothetical protein
MAIKTASDVTKFAKDNKAEIVDLKFCDVPGLFTSTLRKDSGTQARLTDPTLGLTSQAARITAR